MEFQKKQAGSWSDIPYYLRRDRVETFTQFPALIPASAVTGGHLTFWALSGNSQQTGTPAPDNIITPEMCGVRTGNLWNYTIEQGGWDAASGTIPTKYASDDPKFTIRCGVADIIPIPSNTMSLTCPSGIKINFVWINTNGVSLGGSGWQQNGSTVTAPENATSMTFILGKVDDSTYSPNDFQNIMLNSGSTPLPYEPYGWKVPFENRGENLWNEEYDNISGTIQYVPLYVGNGSFTLSTTTPYDLSVANLFLLSGNVSTGASTAGNGAWLNHNVTVQSDSGYITIAYRQYSGTTSPADCKTMLSLGSTPKPYSPYLNATIPVYLGEVPTVRRIKKRVLTGSENWVGNNGSFYADGVTDYLHATYTAFCSHFPTSPNVSSRADAAENSLCFGKGTLDRIFFKWDSFATVNDLIAYFSQQYENNTPVTVWYVLANEQTGIVNEPLCKIGDYADTVSSTSTGAPQIPLLAGSDNIITFGTELPPSEFQAGFVGWHSVQDVHLRSGGQWS